MANPRVTVLMPVYNTGKYVGEAIQSVLNQTFSDFEFIIVNDGSTDNTLEVIQSFTDSRIKLINLEKNSGNRVAANRGLKEAKGEFVVRMDSDDIAVPERIQWQVEFMDKNPEIGLSGGDQQLFGEGSDVWKFPVDQAILNATQIFNPGLSQPTTILRTDVYRKNNLYYNEEGDSFGEDMEYFMRLKKVTAFGNIDKIVIRYRRHAENMTVVFKDKTKGLYNKLFTRILNEIGIEASEKNLMLHMFLNGQFISEIKSSQVKEIKNWMETLIVNGRTSGKYVEKDLREVLNKKWDQLFYKLTDKGFRYGFRWIRANKGCTGIQFTYFSKLNLSKIIGRTKKQVE